VQTVETQEAVPVGSTEKLGEVRLFIKVVSTMKDKNPGRHVGNLFSLKICYIPGGGPNTEAVLIIPAHQYKLGLPDLIE